MADTLTAMGIDYEVEGATDDGLFRVDCLVGDVAIEADGPWHFCDRAPNGPMRLRQRLLKARGLRVESAARRPAKMFESSARVGSIRLPSTPVEERGSFLCRGRGFPSNVASQASPGSSGRSSGAPGLHSPTAPQLRGPGAPELGELRSSGGLGPRSSRASLVGGAAAP